MLRKKQLDEVRQTFLEYIRHDTVVFIKNIDVLSQTLGDLFKKAEKAFSKLSTDIEHSEPNELFSEGELLKKQLLEFTSVEFGTQAFFKTHSNVYLPYKPSTLL